MAVAVSNGNVLVYDTRKEQMIQRYKLHDNVTCVSWQPKSIYMLTSGKDGFLRITDALEGKPLYSLTGHMGEVSSVAFSRDGSSFASGAADKLVMVCTCTGFCNGLIYFNFCIYLFQVWKAGVS